jgi:RimJ/RimL family protein N-acetyltransferase
MTYSDLELAELQAAALFTHDTHGKLLRINEPEPTDPAPRFFLTRTTQGSLWRFRHDLPAELAAQLEALAQTEPLGRDLREPPYHAAAYSDLLARHAPIAKVDAGPSYTLPQLDPPQYAITITPENIALLDKHFAWARKVDDYAPVVVIAVDGAAVAACFSSRLTAQVAEAGVFVEPPYRGRGYAPDVVRGWAGVVRALGKLPLYDTSWTNTASQAVARKLGAVQYAANFSIT